MTLSLYSITEARGIVTTSEPSTRTRAATIGSNFNLIGVLLDTAVYISAQNLRPDTVLSTVDQIDLLSQEESLTVEEIDLFTSRGLDDFINPLASRQPELLYSRGVSLFSDYPEFRYSREDPIISSLLELLYNSRVALFEG